MEFALPDHANQHQGYEQKGKKIYQPQHWGKGMKSDEVDDGLRLIAALKHQQGGNDWQRQSG